tara:strand:- start:1443 stop:1742 length:300 start_codon:yes stop_codon:yes gene_type:complete
LSIEKWVDLEFYVTRMGLNGVYIYHYNSTNCALCHLYTEDFNPTVDTDCEHCPVANATGEDDCSSTPFVDFNKAVEDGRVDDAIGYANDEIKFLESLRN